MIDLAAYAPIVVLLGLLLLMGGGAAYLASYSNRVPVVGLAHDGGVAGYQKCKANKDGTITYRRKSGNVRVALNKSQSYPTPRGNLYLVDVSNGQGRQVYLDSSNQVLRMPGQRLERIAASKDIASINEAAQTDLSKLATTITIGFVVLGIVIMGGLGYIISKLGDVA